MSEFQLAPGERGGWPEAILFDLDGTLIDSAPDIAAAVNILLSRHGLQPLELVEVRSMIGNGIRKLVERAFRARSITLTDADLDARNGEMLNIYGDHLTILTKEMADATETLSAYGQAGVKLGIVTNKPTAFSQTIADHFGWRVGCVIGGDGDLPRKPAPDMLLHACRQLGAPVSRTLLVGDSPADIGAAKAASMACIAVRGGYTAIPADELGADQAINRLGELGAAVERIKETA